jgi:hypothetical protein
MTATIEPSNRRNHERRDGQPADALIRDAALVLDAVGVHRSVSWLSRTVRDFLAPRAAEVPFGLFLAARMEMNAAQRRRLAERADLRYLLTYADPTGEQASRRVARERGERW